jgi:hypothetical protein
LENRKTVKVDFRIPEDAHDELRAIAEGRKETLKRNVYASDIIREAIEEYLARRGSETSTDVKRGGPRRAASA